MFQRPMTWRLRLWTLKTRNISIRAGAVPEHSTPEEDIAAARTWLATFNAENIPKSICDVSFSRSSGPGGQNVNKVNSKATLRLSLSSFLPLVPTALHSSIRNSRLVAVKSDAFVIQSDDSRKQSENVHNCYRKLHQVIVEAARGVIPGETSQATRKKVQALRKADNEARLRSKKTHSSKKAARRGGQPD